MTEKITIPNSGYKPGWGALGTVAAGAIRWQTCRDRFQGDTEPPQIMEILFFHGGIKVGEHVREFINMVEDIIGLAPRHRVKMTDTNDPTVMHIKLSAWWKYRLRRSLLTALLRCGTTYTDRSGKAFERALWSQAYTAATKYAIERFFSGYTGSKLKAAAGFSGWQALFGGPLGVKNAETYLVKERRRRENITGELDGND